MKTKHTFFICIILVLCLAFIELSKSKQNMTQPQTDRHVSFQKEKPSKYKSIRFVRQDFRSLEMKLANGR